MGRYAGPLLGVGLTLATIQLAAGTALWVLWAHDVRRGHR